MTTLTISPTAATLPANGALSAPRVVATIAWSVDARSIGNRAVSQSLPADARICTLEATITQVNGQATLDAALVHAHGREVLVRGEPARYTMSTGRSDGELAIDAGKRLKAVISAGKVRYAVTDLWALLEVPGGRYEVCGR